MSATTDTVTATSSRFGAFALVFGISFAVLYVVCDMAALPMFTYHPGTDRIDPGFSPPRRVPHGITLVGRLFDHELTRRGERLTIETASRVS